MEPNYAEIWTEAETTTTIKFTDKMSYICNVSYRGTLYP